MCIISIREYINEFLFNYMLTEKKIFSLLKDQKSLQLLNEIKSFIDKQEIVPTKNNQLELANNVGEIISEKAIAFGKLHELDYTTNRENYYLVVESLENLISKCLYSKFFKIYSKIVETKLEKNIKRFSFLKLKHFKLNERIDYIDDLVLSNDLKILFELNNYRSPKEKLVVLSSFLINSVVGKFNIDDGEFLIKYTAYCLIKSNVPQLKTNLIFVDIFRHKAIISDQEDFFLSVFHQSVDFIEKLGSNRKTTLSMLSQECEEYLDEYDKKAVLNRPQNYDTTCIKLKLAIESKLLDLLNKDHSKNSENGGEMPCKGVFPIAGDLNDLDVKELKEEYSRGNFQDMSFEKIESAYYHFKSVLSLVDKSRRSLEGSEGIYENTENPKQGKLLI